MDEFEAGVVHLVKGKPPQPQPPVSVPSSPDVARPIHRVVRQYLELYTGMLLTYWGRPATEDVHQYARQFINELLAIIDSMLQALKSYESAAVIPSSIPSFSATAFTSLATAQERVDQFLEDVATLAPPTTAAAGQQEEYRQLVRQVVLVARSKLNTFRA